MKSVYLLRDKRAFWEEIKSHLRGINASIVECRDIAGLDTENFHRNPPSLFITGIDNSDRLLNFQFRNFGIVIISDSGSPGEISPSPLNARWVTVQWPLSKAAFLKLTGEFKQQSERIPFRTVIRLFPEDEHPSFLGQSVDFSLTGICFESDRSFLVDNLLEVSFSPPGNIENITLKCRIVRRSDDENPVRHGAKFLELTPVTRKDLETFMSDR